MNLRTTLLLLWIPSLFWTLKFLMGLRVVMCNTWSAGRAFVIVLQFLAWSLVLRCAGFHVLLRGKRNASISGRHTICRIVRFLADSVIMMISICVDHALHAAIPCLNGILMFVLFVAFDILYCGVVYWSTKDCPSLTLYALKCLKKHE